jgi:hypothetical protein
MTLGYHLVTSGRGAQPRSKTVNFSTGRIVRAYVLVGVLALLLGLAARTLYLLVLNLAGR